MSLITDVLLFGASWADVDALNLQLLGEDELRSGGQFFRAVDLDGAGGHKVFTSDLWACSFNYMPVDLVDALRDPKTWERSVLLALVIIIDGEDDAEVIMFDSQAKVKGATGALGSYEKLACIMRRGSEGVTYESGAETSKLHGWRK